MYSIARQFHEKGTLSARQIAAVHSISKDLELGRASGLLHSMDISQLLYMLTERDGWHAYVHQGISIIANDRKDGIVVKRLNLTVLGNASAGIFYAKRLMSDAELFALHLNVVQPDSSLLIVNAEVNFLRSAGEY